MKQKQEQQASSTDVDQEQEEGSRDQRRACTQSPRSVSPSDVMTGDVSDNQGKQSDHLLTPDDLHVSVTDLDASSADQGSSCSSTSALDREAAVALDDSQEDAITGSPHHLGS